MAMSPRRSCSGSACSVPSVSRTEPMDEPSKLLRRSAIARILGDRGDMLVVAGLGSPTYNSPAVGDHPLNFYLWGAMGTAETVGLGLALPQPKPPLPSLTAAPPLPLAFRPPTAAPTDTPHTP